MIERALFGDDFSAKGEKCSLRMLKECDKDAYLDVNRENSQIASAYDTPLFTQIMWDTAFTDEITFAILDNESGNFIGYINLHHLTRENPEMGIDLFAAYHSKGIGTEAVLLLLEQLRCRTATGQKLTARVEVDNIASQRMLKKIGAVQTGMGDSSTAKVIKALADELGEDGMKRIKESCRNENIDFDEVFNGKNVIEYEIDIA